MSHLVVDTEVIVPARDGIGLATTVIRPGSDHPAPAILVRTPYDRTTYASVSLQVHALRLASAGYAVVLQDVRGRGASGGVFTPFVNEQDDGVDTVEWLAGQTWCNGSIGLAGTSYAAFTQMALMVANPEPVRCWVPGLTACDVRSSWIRRGGVPDYGFHLAWGLGSIGPTDRRTASPEDLLRAHASPLETGRRQPKQQIELASTPAGSWFFEWMEREDPFEGNPRVPGLTELAGVSAPALVVAGWWDVFSSGSHQLIGTLRSGSATSSRLVAGPWDHSGLPLGRRSGDRDFGLSAAVDLHALQIEWFDQHLRDGDPVEMDRVFVTGRDAWIDEPSWPPQTEDLTLGLGEDGRLGEGDVKPGSTEVRLDPDDPTPVHGGGLYPWEPALRPGCFDQRARRNRGDVASFDSSPLATSTLIAGNPRLNVRLDLPEGPAPVYGTLVEIEESGRVWNISEGIGLTDPTTGDASIELGPVGHELKAGSAIGIDIAFAADVRLAPVGSGRRVLDLSVGVSQLTLPVVS